MRRKIPQPVLAVVADYAAGVETHDTLNGLFRYAGCPGDPPPGSKPAKALEWLRRVNKDESVEPLEVLGRLLEGYMEKPSVPGDWGFHEATAFRAKVAKALSAASLVYRHGGLVTDSLAAPTRKLQSFIKGRDINSLSEEFERAASKADREPREAVSAAANILESICKHYVEERGLAMPSKQVLGDLWNVVRKDLGFDPSQVADDDLRTILTGLIQVVQGLGAFRTHASSAHGAGPKAYRLEPRHSRLAVHAAHTAALFILESWDKKVNRQATT
jgi:hypothetical protein